ncbi:MAG: hypothetical protein J3R72DRAFT_500160 [Linnemannia gamsii]|nr:MAG: hypothetical protein J3R72DRAFT_500160 [Linnemannia gamsii]
MDTTSFEDLPHEIQESVSQYLDQWDLRVCVGVSRAWRSMFHSHLWRHVHIIWRWDTRLSNTPTELKTNGHLIRSLRLECDEIYLHEFYWAVGYKFVPGFFDALIEHAAPTLEVLRFEGVLTISGNDINRTLCSAPNLKELRFAHDGIYGANSCIKAQDIVNSEWVCNDLEVFAWPIGAIPRPDITRALYGGRNHGGGTLQESINLQRRVYAKLARLTKLRELSLGMPLTMDKPWVIDDVEIYVGSTEDYRQCDGLAMTLDSGLDLLRDLKNLRIVGLTDMEVYIDGDKEQTWVAEHWPNATIEFIGYERDSDSDL